MNLHLYKKDKLHLLIQIYTIIQYFPNFLQKKSNLFSLGINCFFFLTMNK